MTPKESAIAIAQSLATAEQDPTPENLEAHHAALWKHVHMHADLLGLTETDLQEIGAAGSGVQARDGEPKKPPQED